MEIPSSNFFYCYSIELKFETLGIRNSKVAHMWSKNKIGSFLKCGKKINEFGIVVAYPVEIERYNNDLSDIIIIRLLI